MTEPSQYFKGRTVQEQMDEVIGYVDKRAGEVAAAKADAVLQPAEEAKTAAQAAAATAEAAKDTTLAALPDIRQDISGLKAEDVALDGRLNTVELKVQTAEGNIVTIQGQITSIENKDTQQDSAIAALQTADTQNVKISRINEYALGLTGNQISAGVKGFRNYTMKINPAFKRDVPAENYKYLVLESLATDIGEPATAQTYFALGGGSPAYIAQKSIGWDLHGKSSDNKDWAGRFALMLDPDNGQLSLTMRLQNLTDGTNKSTTVTTLSMV